jgi:hypothetical protein
MTHPSRPKEKNKENSLAAFSSAMEEEAVSMRGSPNELDGQLRPSALKRQCPAVSGAVEQLLLKLWPIAVLLGREGEAHLPVLK